MYNRLFDSHMLTLPILEQINSIKKNSIKKNSILIIEHTTINVYHKLLNDENRHMNVILYEFLWIELPDFVEYFVSYEHHIFIPYEIMTKYIFPYCIDKYKSNTDEMYDINVEFKEHMIFNRICIWIIEFTYTPECFNRFSAICKNWIYNPYRKNNTIFNNIKLNYYSMYKNLLSDVH